MTPAPPFLLDETDLPGTELRAATLDGDLLAVGARYCPVDVARSADAAGRRDLRALALLPAVPRGLVAELTTAAWVHGAWAGVPRPLALCVRSDHRVRAAPSPERSVRQTVLRPADVMEVAGLLVTSPQRTAVDLLRVPERFDRRRAACVATLLLMTEGGFDHCASALHGAAHVPHKQRALERLDEVRRMTVSRGPEATGRPRGQPPETRYTS
ncbi:hypothetical protein ACEXQB_009740 [Herbiconiux sp. P18]|uniref:hypothetical protein n=1 Tax=Herbiconiux liangxiaofengii TaxID=3342795 RepID=UPI0035B9E312